MAYERKPWRYVMAHEYGRVDPTKIGPEMFNPYHALVTPTGDVYRRHGDADAYNRRAPHGAGWNDRALGLSYLGPVGGRPSAAGLQGLKNEYQRMMRDAGDPARGDMPVIGHGQAQQLHLRDPRMVPAATADPRGRSVVEGQHWRDQVADLSQVPAGGLKPLGPVDTSGIGLGRDFAAPFALATEPAPRPVAERGLIPRRMAQEALPPAPLPTPQPEAKPPPETPPGPKAAPSLMDLAKAATKKGDDKEPSPLEGLAKGLAGGGNEALAKIHGENVRAHSAFGPEWAKRWAAKPLPMLEARPDRERLHRWFG